MASATPDFTTYDSATFATTGGSSSVYKTIADVNLKSFSAGDNIYFRRNQTWNEFLNFPSAGAVGNPITIGAFGDNSNPKPKIDLAGGGATALQPRNYVTIQDFQITGGITYNLKIGGYTGVVVNRVDITGGSIGMGLTGASSATINDSTITGSTGNGIQITGTSSVVINNTTVASSTSYGFYSETSGSIEINDSIFRNNGSMGMRISSGCLGVSTYTLNRNTFNNNSTNGFMLSGNGGCTVTINNSISHNNLEDGFSVNSSNTSWNTLNCNNCLSYNNGSVGIASSGDAFTSHTYSVMNLRNCIAYNNWGSGLGAVFTSSGTVYNCTFYNNKNAGLAKGYGLWLDTDGAQTWIWKNNIVYGHNYEVYVTSDSISQGLTLTSDNNNFYNTGVAAFNWNGTTSNFSNYQSNSNKDISSFNLDPLLLNVSGNDFRLTSLSQSINAGTDLSSIFTTDYSGTTRPQGSSFDIGAYEYIYPVPGGAQPSYTTYSGSAPLPVTITEMNNVISLVNAGVFKYDAYFSVGVTPKIGSFRIPNTNYWQVGSIYEVWWKSWFNNAKILPYEVVKPFTLIFKYDPSALEKSLSEKRLRLAYSTDSKTWKIIPSTLDTKKKQLVIITKNGGYYMLVSGYPQTTQSVQGVETEVEPAVPEPTSTPTTQSAEPTPTPKPKRCFLFICW